MPRIEINLPDPPRPGGELFKPDADWWHNAVLDTFSPSWYVYAEGYRRAADACVGQLMTDRQGIDFLIYPILFLYRQYLELSLKLTLADAEEILSGEQSTMRTHDLGAIWTHCRERLEAATDIPSTDLDVIDNVVKQFSTVDPSSEAFRYPTRKDGSPVAHAIKHVNIRIVQQEMSNAANVIEATSNHLSVLVDQRRELMADFRL